MPDEHSPDTAQQVAPAPAATVLPPSPGLPPFIVPGPISFGQPAVAMQVWQSQYPPPEAVERFDAVLPGSWNRILTMVEKGQEAQLAAVVQVNQNLQSDTRRGAWLGFTVAMVGLGGAIVCAAIGQPWVAAALVSVPVLGLARSLVESGRAQPPAQPPAK